MRFSGSLAFVAICLCAGCATTGRSEPIKHPIVGTWILNAARTSPAAATNPSLANEFTSTLTFTPDGKYHAVTTWSGKTGEVNGTYRIVGPDVYLDLGTGERKGLYEIRGNEIFVSDRREPGILVYDRQ